MESLYAFQGRVIDGNGGEPIENGLVVVEGNRIKAVCRADEYPLPPVAKVIAVPDGTILPGLIDCHEHIGMCTVRFVEAFQIHPYERVARACNELKALLNAGFTTVRDCGGCGVHLKKAAADNIIDSPRLVCAGRVITQTNGHFDLIKSWPVEYNDKGNILAYVVDGPDEIRKAIRLNFRDGADFVKMMLSPSISSQSACSDIYEFSDEEVRVGREEAARCGTFLEAHAITNQGLKHAIRNGAQIIDHADFVQVEDVEALLQSDCKWVIPTLSILHVYMEAIRTGVNRDKLSPWAIVKTPPAYESQLESIHTLYKAGVKLGCGADFGGDKYLGPHGANGMEFERLCAIGMSPMESIMAGTKTGSEIIMNPDLGTLAEGKLADVIVVKGNPLEDIRLLGNADNVKVVMKDGLVKKQID